MAARYIWQKQKGFFSNFLVNFIARVNAWQCRSTHGGDGGCALSSLGVQPGNGYRVLCAPDGESHGKGIRERGEWRKSSFLSKVNSVQGQRLYCGLLGDFESSPHQHVVLSCELKDATACVDCESWRKSTATLNECVLSADRVQNRPSPRRRHSVLLRWPLSSWEGAGLEGPIWPGKNV